MMLVARQKDKQTGRQVKVQPSERENKGLYHELLSKDWKERRSWILHRIGL